MKRIIIFLLFLPIIIFSTEETNNAESQINNDSALNETTSVDKKFKFYYFNPKEEGAAAFYNPLQFVVEGGFGALYNMKIDRFEWQDGVENLWNGLSDPAGSIDKYGWKNFFMHEFIPHTGSGQGYTANWVWHFIGGGFRTKLLEEYYIYNNYEYPKLYAWLTMYSMHFINEIIQASKFKSNKASIDALPDLLFFDWVGKLFFEIDFVNNIFANHLHLRDWSYQTQYEVATNRLLNNGQLYWVRYEIYDPISISCLTGEQISSFNITYQTKSKRQFSIGVGAKAKAFMSNAEGGTDTSGIVMDFGFYYSINDNPFIVLTYEPEEKDKIEADPRYKNEYTQKLILNIYPGFLKINNTSFGMSFMIQKEAFFIGFTSGQWPAGFIFSTPQGQEYLDAN